MPVFPFEMFAHHFDRPVIDPENTVIDFQSTIKTCPYRNHLVTGLCLLRKDYHRRRPQ